MLRLDQGDALTARGRAQQQQLLVKARPAPAAAVRLEAVGLQPQRPVGTVGILQQRVLQAIYGFIQCRPTGEQRRAANG
ncbi:hypothetical protein D3C79_985870 [compost metagenome]